MFLKICFIPELVHIPKHGPMLHMMSIDQTVRILKGIVIPGIQKQRPGIGKFPIHIFVQIFRVGASLYHRIIDMGLIHPNPCTDLGIDLF